MLPWRARGVLSLVLAMDCAVAAPEATSETYFFCEPPANLKDRVALIRLPSQVVSEIDEKYPYRGGFSANRLELQLSDRRTITIRLAEELGFNAASKSKHDACKAFHFHVVDDWIFFDYVWGNGNPYPAQQVAVSDRNKLGFYPLEFFGGAFKQVYFADFDVRQGCLTLHRERDVERGCFRSGTYVVEDRTIDFSSKVTGKNYRFVCHLTSPDTRISRLDEVMGRPPVNAQNIPVAIGRQAELLCSDARSGNTIQKLQLP